MWGAEGLQALTAAAADEDVAGTSMVAPKRQLMETSLAVVLSRPQAVMPIALPQRMHLIRVEAPPFSMHPQQTIKGGRRSAFYLREGMVQEVMATLPTVDVPLQPRSQTE